MKRNVSISILLVFSFYGTIGQIISPGGVKGVAKWLVVSVQNDIPCFVSRTNTDIKLFPATLKKGNLKTLNYNNSFPFTENTKINIDLKQQKNSFSFFTVYQPEDTVNENSIWHLLSNKKTAQVLTTDRAADLEAYRYMNFINLERRNPKVNVYVQQKEDPAASVSDFEWQLGAKPVSPDLPITSFKGSIPEVIFYNRVLNTKERLKVASYLSIKYGVTLSEPEAIYYNSQGVKIWEGLNYRAFHKNIAGIARDDSSGLMQPKASSSSTPGLLTISSNSVLSDNSFLLWGENGLPFVPEKKVLGFPQLMQKKWLLVSNLMKDISTRIMIDTRQMDVKADANTVFWMAIDLSRTGAFAFEKTDFIKMDQIDANGIATFNDIKWEKGEGQKSYIGFIAARDLLVTEKINQPVCSTGIKGSLDLKFAGGLAPYKVSVSGEEYNGFYNLLSDTSTSLKINNLPPGKYHLNVTDALKRSFTDSFYLNSVDAPLPILINSNYELALGKSVEIDASQNMPEGVSYSWEGIDNFSSIGPKQVFEKPGVYTLTLSKNGCSSKTDIQIAKSSGSVFKEITVFPNPSTGDFFARVQLQQPDNLSMTIYASNGSIIKSAKKSGFANYIFKDKITKTGIYMVTFRSGKFEETRKIVIVK
ncbi:T9SS type A sorting domain-containing protein [Ferruginibacter sp. SUN002]|uniref:T9SS type A sorting domain-containing protein n=1 Tax=Ferruginibacter sp. SUN002 TaxID=2937789 RepID=UPI003D3643CA